jgi:hypothetical protein
MTDGVYEKKLIRKLLDSTKEKLEPVYVNISFRFFFRKVLHGLNQEY